MRNPVRRAALVIAGIAVAALVAPWLAPYDPNAVIADGTRVALPPSADHLLGTDLLSRDVLSRLLDGARVSLGVALLAVLVALGIGSSLGAAAALQGGWARGALMRFTDTLLAFPRVLLLLLLVAATGPVHPAVLALMIGATGWMTTARLVYHETERLLSSEFVLAARAMGLPAPRLIRVHILPALAPTLVAAGTIALASAIPLEAALSFLGLGVPLPQASWGNLITDAEGQLLRRWWLVLFPTLAIVGTVFALNVVGERLGAQRRRTPQ